MLLLFLRGVYFCLYLFYPPCVMWPDRASPCDSRDCSDAGDACPSRGPGAQAGPSFNIDDRAREPASSEFSFAQDGRVWHGTEVHCKYLVYQVFTKISISEGRSIISVRRWLQMANYHRPQQGRHQGMLWPIDWIMETIYLAIRPSHVKNMWQRIQTRWLNTRRCSGNDSWLHF